LIDIKGDKRLYMITENSDSEYLKNTYHNRMPIGEKIYKIENKKTAG
jgi:hypothetical protein